MYLFARPFCRKPLKLTQRHFRKLVVETLELRAMLSAFSFLKIADTNTEIPGTAETFLFFYHGSAEISSGHVAFVGAKQDGTRGIYRYSDNILSLVADETVFPGLDLASIAMDNEKVAFLAGTVWGDPGRDSAYLHNGQSVHLIADTNTTVPNQSATFSSFSRPSMADGKLAIYGRYRTSPNMQSGGIYLFDNGLWETLVSPSTSIQGEPSSARLSTIPLSPSLSEGTVALSSSFRVTSEDYSRYWDRDAILIGNGGSLRKIADSRSYYYEDGGTAIPGGTGAFGHFGTPSYDEGSVVFYGAAGRYASSDPGGIYTNVGGGLRRVADTTTPIPNGTGTFTGFYGYWATGPAIDGQNIVFTGFGEDGQSGIYMELNGSLVKVVDRSDAIDGKTPLLFNSSHEAVSGTSVVFGVTFTDGSQGIYRTTPASDIVATSLTWDTANAGVEFEYSVEGADLPQETTAALYWASGPTRNEIIGDAVYSTTIDRHQTSQPVTRSVAIDDLTDPPSDATHLLVVVDPPSVSNPDGLIEESDEDNNDRALPIAELLFREMDGVDSWFKDGSGGTYLDIPGWDHVALSVFGKVYESQFQILPGDYYDVITGGTKFIGFRNGVVQEHTIGTFLHNARTFEQSRVQHIARLAIRADLALAMEAVIRTQLGKPYPSLPFVLDPADQKGPNTYTCVGVIEWAAEQVGGSFGNVFLSGNGGPMLLGDQGLVRDAWEQIDLTTFPGVTNTLSPSLMYYALTNPNAQIMTSDQLLSAVFDPVDFIITDPMGRRIGFTDTTGLLDEIPGAFYSGNGSLEQVLIPDALFGQYKIEVFGLDEEALLAVGSLTHGVFFEGYLARDESLSMTTLVGPVADIDIKPGSDRNPINLNANGVIPITIFSTADFNASWVDVSTVQFAGASVAHWAFEDVDGDGQLDLVLHFRLQDTHLLDTYAELLRQDLEDGKLDETRKSVDALLTGQASNDDEDVFDFLGSDSVDLFLAGGKLRDLLNTL